MREKGFVANITHVLAIQVPDVPGGLADALVKIGTVGLDVEYMYAFIGNTSEHAFVIVRVENPEVAAGLIEKAGIKVLKGEQAYLL